MKINGLFVESDTCNYDLCLMPAYHRHYYSIDRREEWLSQKDNSFLGWHVEMRYRSYGAWSLSTSVLKHGRVFAARVKAIQYMYKFATGYNQRYGLTSVRMI